MALSLPGVDVFTFTDSDLDWPRSEHDPEKLAQALRADRPDLRGVMLLADPFTPIVTLLPALSKTVSRPNDRPSVPVFGGIASAGKQAGDNRLLRNDEIRNGGIVGIGFSGALRMDTLVSQGCRPIGQPMVITSAKRNIIETLGGKPAMAAFQEMALELADCDRELIQEKGLFVGRVVTEYQEQFSRGDFLIRNVIGIDREQGLLAVSDLMRTGQTMQFHVRDAAAADEDLRWMLAAQALDDEPFAGLLFTCNGRGKRLFQDKNHDASAIRKAMPGLPLAGFSAAGEIGPVGNQTFLHGHTASIALLRGM
jgi:small ligand-binding sensory domain FIST